MTTRATTMPPHLLRAADVDGDRIEHLLDLAVALLPALIEGEL